MEEYQGPSTLRLVVVSVAYVLILIYIYINRDQYKRNR